ncbi:MAG: hypothetical protein KAS64_02830 [Spirochaetes bacterium]|nr:hypothetical protein [Spirochaetota bacterium]
MKKLFIIIMFLFYISCSYDRTIVYKTNKSKFISTIKKVAKNLNYNFTLEESSDKDFLTIELSKFGGGSIEINVNRVSINKIVADFNSSFRNNKGFGEQIFLNFNYALNKEFKFNHPETIFNYNEKSYFKFTILSLMNTGFAQYYKSDDHIYWSESDKWLTSIFLTPIDAYFTYRAFFNESIDAKSKTTSLKILIAYKFIALIFGYFDLKNHNDFVQSKYFKTYNKISSNFLNDNLTFSLVNISF